MMYTRAYYDDPVPTVPESYSGNAFSDAAQDEASTYVAPSIAEAKISPKTAIPEDDDTESVPTLAKERSGGFFEGLYERLPFKKLFGGEGGFLGRLKIKFDVEDILIIAVAALLILSKEGDTIFGIMLLALLFVD